jgi:N-acetylneuraminate synthase
MSRSVLHLTEFSIDTPRGRRAIGEGHPTFVIAEMSANHNQNFATAERIVRSAAEAGADAIKLQTYLPSTMTIDCDLEPFVVRGSTTPGQWKDRTLYALYEKAYTPWAWHQPLRDLAHDLGLVFFSTPFDATAVEYLHRLGVPMYKIASYELTDLPLLATVARTGRPVIISTGFGTVEEVAEAVGTLRANGCRDLVVLHCVTSYAGEPDEHATNLRTIQDLRDRFGVISGFSDNTGGIEVPLQAAMMGAVVIEKHLSAEDDTTAIDASFSVKPSELKELVTRLRRAERLAGRPSYGPQSENEKYFQRFRRSLFVVADIKRGEPFSVENVRVIRPAGGLAPRHLSDVLGRRAASDLGRGTPLDWSMIE